jgi:FlaA1/EpsC-like NDP-sugar epimerase
MKLEINKINLSNFSKKLILIFSDISIIIFAIIFSYSLRLDSLYNPFDIDYRVYLIFISVFIITFYLNNIYQILISFFDSQSIIKIIRIVLLSQIILFILNIIFFKSFFFPRSISIIAPIISCILFVLLRITLNYLINLKKNRLNHENKILIYGINEKSLSLLKDLRNYPNYGKVIAFVDKKNRYRKRELSGIKIFKNADFDKVIKDYHITEIIINSKEYSKKDISLLYKKFEKENIRIRNLAETENSKNFLKKLLEIKPSFYDIIDRPKITVDKNILNKSIKGRNILITGGGGSIGSELSIEILKHKPRKVYILEISEINLFKIINKIKKLKKFNQNVIVPVLGDCADKNFLMNKFDKINIDDLYHSAAYKHVSFGETNPYSMIKNNVLGTKTVAEFALQKKIKRFIFISSDKAVNPKSILGFSKKIGEKILIDLFYRFKNKCNTIFTIVRFGNVIGSSGSVIPIFMNQIESTSSLTVTSKKVTRYFMSISEAIQLVINASYFNNKGVEIYALDMGKQINIYELAKRIIRLSGLTVKDKRNLKGDIVIKITGLKKGEKLYEEVSLGKNLIKTPHPKIMKCDEKMNHNNFYKKIKKIEDLLNKKRFEKKILKDIV